MASVAAFTCITCQVAFADADLQRSHYKTDWHRYNLKRKVAALPPVTAEGFNQRVLAQRAQISAEETREKSFYCEPCKKKLSSQAAFENHNSSSKHKQNVVRLEEHLIQSADSPQATENYKQKKETSKNTLTSTTEPAGSSADMEVTEDADDEDVEEDWDEDALGLEECLFCSKISQSLENNVQHMTTNHSFFIPDIEYLVDLEGLITYLGEKISQGKMCLWCNDRSKLFRTVKATQQHMVDKGHCMLYYENDAMCEYADYYDYAKSYPDGEEADPNMEVSLNVLEQDDDYQLTLPSGSKIGHRALSRYYKQNLVSRSNPEGRKVLNKVLNQYRALGWTGATGAAAERRVKDLQYMQRTKQKHWQKLALKANKFQPHFRPQVIF